MKNSIQLFFSILFLLFFVKCAKRASPTGGPKDSIPPRLINASPKLNTTFFDKDGFTLTFDEYVTLKDVNKQLIVSPPLSSTKYKVYPTTGASKKISLELSDSLMKNTTYTFNFGESIVDFNESNPAKYLTYTLSTGSTIDSLYVKGKITDAFEKETESFISVQLYPIDSSYNDSTIYTNKPLYVTSTLDTIIYRFQNLRAGKYNLIAIQDLAGNYLFDQSVDKIGFIEQPIELPKDSIINLSIFKERTNFYWDAPYFINDHHVALAYFGEYNNESFKMISEVPDSFEAIVTKNRETDSLDYWFKGAVLDSIKFELEIQDTLRIKTAFSKKEPVNDSLIIKKYTKGSLRLEENLELESNLPITKVDTTKIKVTNIDTLQISANLEVLKNFDRIRVNFEVLPSDKYEITLFPNALQDFWGRTHDTLVFKTTTRKKEDYGNIFLRVKHDSPYPIILELLKNKKIIRRNFNVISGNTYSFDLLDPGKYNVRLIEDANNNSKWDPGIYLEKIQPEKVIYYWKDIELRANWDMNETFNTNQNYPDLPKSEIASDSLQVPNNLK